MAAIVQGPASSGDHGRHPVHYFSMYQYVMLFGRVVNAG